MSLVTLPTSITLEFSLIWVFEAQADFSVSSVEMYGQESVALYLSNQ